MLALSLSICFSAATTNAQEINPAPGTYVYGSSSEFSPYATLGFRANSTSLAPTGESLALPITLLISMTMLGVLLLFASITIYRHN